MFTTVGVGIVDAQSTVESVGRSIPFNTRNTIAIGSITIVAIRIAILTTHIPSRAVSIRSTGRASTVIDLEPSIATGASTVSSHTDIATGGAVLTG